MIFPPVNSCDCHVHVIGPKADFPLQEQRAYTPADASCSDLIERINSMDITRVVLIQTSIFGTDNACLLNGLKQLGLSRARAVVVPEPTISTQTQDEWHALGVRGLRLNLTTRGTPPVETIRKSIAEMLPLCERNGWHMQFFLPAATIVELAADLQKLPVPCVLDHFGLLSPLQKRTDAQLAQEAAIMKLLDTGNVWLKLSGTYRIADDRHHPGITSLAQRLYGNNPQRMLWASDWPHTPAHVPAHTPAHVSSAALRHEEQPYRDIDTRLLLEEFAQWFPDSEHRCQILVSNPAELYQFEA